MSATKTPIFVLGATGYVGGSVVTRLLSHPDAASFDITALVRSPEKAKKLETFGIKPVIGTLADHDKIEALAEQADVVFNIAEADDVSVIDAVLRGIKKRHDKTGTLPALIHTSGTGVLDDDAKGSYASDKIYSDLDIDEILALPDTAFHRGVELAVLRADKNGYVRTYIISPSTIYGRPSGPFVDAGFQNLTSIQIPYLIQLGLSRKQGGVVGEGKSIWPSVHIDDIADLYIVVYNHLKANPTAGHGREGYYHGENGEHTWLDLTQRISAALAELGIGSSTPVPFTAEEEKAFFPNELLLYGLSSNARCRADRSRAIGWKPTRTTADLFASIKPEVLAQVKAANAQ